MRGMDVPGAGSTGPYTHTRAGLTRLSRPRDRRPAARRGAAAPRGEGATGCRPFPIAGVALTTLSRRSPRAWAWPNSPTSGRHERPPAWG